MTANDWMGLRQLGEPEIEGETAGARGTNGTKRLDSILVVNCFWYSAMRCW